QQLPTELLEAVLHHVHPSDLAVLSTTSSLTYSVAQRLLYRHIRIDCLSRNLGIVITLSRRPHIARHVRSFSIRLYSYSFLFKSFYRQLHTALSAMTELVSLDLFADSSSSWVLETPCHSSYDRLVHFSSSFSLDRHVAHFLSKTSNLVDLQLDSGSPVDSCLPITLPPTSLPRLSEFAGPSDIAQAIVPGRPVETIHLTSGDMSLLAVEHLAKSTGRVVVLGASTSLLPVPLLVMLGQKMPHLVYLRMMTTYNFDGAPDTNFYHDIASALSSLHNLKAFELSGMHWGSSAKDLIDGRVWQSEPFNSTIESAEHLSPDSESHADVVIPY
ncbi:hypothetical protein BDQ17DRAFT_1236270, partial [Cyathus striatus]